MEGELSEINPSAEERDSFRAIEFKRKQLTKRLSQSGLKFTSEQMKKHIEDNTLDGVYPFTAALPREAEDE